MANENSKILTADQEAKLVSLLMIMWARFRKKSMASEQMVQKK